MNLTKVDKITSIFLGILLVVSIGLFIADGKFDAAFWAIMFGVTWLYSIHLERKVEEKKELMKRHDRHLIRSLENSREIELITLYPKEDY